MLSYREQLAQLEGNTAVIVGGADAVDVHIGDARETGSLQEVVATRLFSPKLRAAAAHNGAVGSSIINFTSSEADLGAPAITVYAAMKSALTSLTGSLLLELGGDSIRVNTIAPDVIETGALPKIPGERASQAPWLADSSSGRVRSGSRSFRLASRHTWTRSRR